MSFSYFFCKNTNFKSYIWLNLPCECKITILTLYFNATKIYHQ